jgi:hypothetical protein
MTAQTFGQAAPDEPKPVDPSRMPLRTEDRKFAKNDFENVRFNTVAGTIQFTVAGVEYTYNPRWDSPEPRTGAAVLACAAVLEQLRRAQSVVVKVPIRVDMPADRKQVTVWELVIPITNLN